ncbi:cell cycle transcriptional regulator TrcR [Lyticum sinuosum]|uniref:DUF1013 domain-containing protein n=1 Tax=Lyticum sinuosum TaxID=1332059 RepID=A0AAE4VM34_9RICK|nr:cell cycle transcriptional regulator TrcR [Lyticum sinuosum]MDZ5761248.1 DUF1013 domain-containing protein [Lyticum sinuosum]
MPTSKTVYPLLPKAIAMWLIQNTTLTFNQIADFCGIHTLEIKVIADGEGSRSVVSYSPVSSKQLTWEEIKRGENDPTYKIKVSDSLKNIIIEENKRLKKKYTPLKQRKCRRNGIMWLINRYPEIPDKEIAKLLSSTKTTVSSIRDRTYWDMSNITPRDPVLLGLCHQKDVNALKEKYVTNNRSK